MALTNYVIFLDIDGVLNNSGYWRFMYKLLGHDRYYRKIRKGHEFFDPISIHFVKKLIESYESNITVVISSTWRLSDISFNRIRRLLESKVDAFGMYISKTTVHVDHIRGLEIQDWLITHKMDESNCKYVIIDDDDFDIINYKGVPDFSKHFVKCDNRKGFKKTQYKRAFKILRGDEVEPYRRNI